MSDILTDLSTPALIHAVKDNLLDFFRYLKQAAHTDFYADEKFARWRTRVPHPWFNGVVSSYPPDEEDLPFIADTIAYFRGYDVSVFTWWSAPAVPFALWEGVLRQHGFHADHDTPGLAIDLEHLPADQPAPPALNIVPVGTLAQLKTWTRTFIAGFELPLAWEADFYDLMSGLGLDGALRNYLGYLDGEAVATSSLFLGAGVAGIYDVATVPPARGRGLGTALTCAPLFEARALGYRAGILQSSEMGYNVYRRLGFQHLCQLDHFHCATDIDLEA